MAIARSARRAAARCSKRSRRSTIGSTARPARFAAGPPALIGMVVPDITNVFFASLVHGVEALAERDGYDLLIVSTSEDAAQSSAAASRRWSPAASTGSSSCRRATIRWPRSKAARTDSRLPPDGADRPRRPRRRIRHRARRLLRRRLCGGAPPHRPRTPRHRRSHPLQAPRQYRAAHRRLPPRARRGGPRRARPRHLRRP